MLLSVPAHGDRLLVSPISSTLPTDMNNSYIYGIEKKNIPTHFACLEIEWRWLCFSY
jgi:hypothetical protein